MGPHAPKGSETPLSLQFHVYISSCLWSSPLEVLPSVRPHMSKMKVIILFLNSLTKKKKKQKWFKISVTFSLIDAASIT